MGGGVSNALPLPSLPPLLQSTSCNFSFQAILLRHLTPPPRLKEDSYYLGEKTAPCHVRSRAPALGWQLFSEATTQETDPHIYSSPLMFVKCNILMDSLRVFGVLTYSLPSFHLSGLPEKFSQVGLWQSHRTANFTIHRYLYCAAKYLSLSLPFLLTYYPSYKESKRAQDPSFPVLCIQNEQTDARKPFSELRL